MGMCHKVSKYYTLRYQILKGCVLRLLLLAYVAGEGAK